MSRIGRLPVTIPSGVEITIDGQVVRVKGPKGQLEHTVAAPITVARGESGAIEVSRPDDERLSRSLHGLTRTLISNMVQGVTQGYEKKMEIVGTGYRVMAKGSNLEFALGYSHPVLIAGGTDGVWYTEPDPTRIGRVTIAGDITEYDVPDPDQTPMLIASGSRGVLWYAETDGAHISRITP